MSTARFATRRLATRRVAVSIAAAAILAITLASAVAAGNGLGAYVSLGFNNTIGNYATTITAHGAKNALQIVNTYTSAARAIYAESRSSYATVWANNRSTGTALALTVANNVPPVRVMNPASGTATNLSADTLDGVDSTGFLRDDLQQAEATSASTGSEGEKTAIATCPAGKYVTGGGAALSVFAEGATLAIVESRPVAAQNGWIARAVETSAYGPSWTVNVYALCATATP